MDTCGRNWRNNHVAGSDRRGLLGHYHRYVRADKQFGKRRANLSYMEHFYVTDPQLILRVGYIYMTRHCDFCLHKQCSGG